MPTPRFHPTGEGFTLVELMIVVAIVGILAAIAIPQFMESVDRAKSTETDQIMATMADGASSYFQQEQHNCGGNKSACPSPWHNTGGVAGEPVSFPSKTYPGGDGFKMNFLPAGSVPEGGTKIPPRSNFNTTEEKVIGFLGVEFKEPLYFQYRYRSTGTGNQASATFRAEADFAANGSPNHRVIQSLTVEDGQPHIGSAFELNKGE